MSTEHEGLRAWSELLRTSREGLMPKYWVGQRGPSFHCTHPKCRARTIGPLVPESWEERRIDSMLCLFAYRHHESCPWSQHIDNMSQTSFTTQPLERAYLYWAQLEHKLNHK